MIAKYPGQCRYCHRPIEVGADEYDTATKTNYHVECHESQPADAETYALAERLGFVSVDVSRIDDWETMLAHWRMLRRRTV